MQFTLALAILASLAAQVTANGTLEVCTGNNGGGSCFTFNEVPPANCNGGCVAITDKSAKQISADSGYCFTVYTDSNCNSGARRVPSNFINGNFKAFSYDCC